MLSDCPRSKRFIVSGRRFHMKRFDQLHMNSLCNNLKFETQNSNSIFFSLISHSIQSLEVIRNYGNTATQTGAMHS